MEGARISSPQFSLDAAESWKSAIEEFGDGIWVYHVELGRLELSENWQEILQLPSRELGLADWLKRIASEERADVAEDIQDLIALRVSNLRIEYTIQNGAGEHIEILHRFSIRERAEEGRKALVIIGQISPQQATQSYKRERPTDDNTADFKSELIAMEHAYNTADVGSWYWNIETGERTFDETYWATLGYGIDEFSGVFDPWEQIIFEEDRPETFSKYEKHVASRGTTPYFHVSRYRHKSGKKVYIKSRGKITKWSPAGKPLIMEGIHIDVSEEHTAHQEVERLSLLLEQTNRTAKVGGWEYVPATNSLTWTATTYAIHGFDPQACPAIDVAKAINFYKEGASRERIAELVERSMREPFSYDEEFQIITIQGNEKWVRAHGLSEFKDGKCLRLFGSFQDIHESKLAELKLKAEEAKFRELYESAPIAITKSCTRTGRLLDANQSAQELTGYNIEELRTLSYHDLTPGEYHDGDRIQDELLLQTGRFGPFEKEYQRKDGSRCEIQLTGFIMDPEGTPTTWTLIQDISERKKSERSIIEAMESAERAKYAKSAFLAAMSHEIRTPLNGIIGSTELLQETEIDEAQDGLIKMILNSCEVLLSTISDVLDYSKIEAGQMELEKQEFSPLDVAEQVIDIMTPKAISAGIEIGVVVNPSCPQGFTGDAIRIRQILINFVGNAVKFTHDGYVEIGIDLTEDGKLHLWVHDTGIGIAEEKIQEVFKPFTQADASTTRRYGGTGLGLAICKSLAQMMGGHLAIESALGEGSVFSVFLPLSIAENSDRPSQAALTGKKALVIRTTQFSDRLIEKAIHTAGGQAVFASDFLEAEAQVNEADGVDVILAPRGFYIAHAQGTPRTETSLRIFKTPLVTIENQTIGSKQESTRPESICLEKPFKTTQVIQACKSAIQTSQFKKPEKSTPTAKPAAPISKVLVVEDNETNKALIMRMLSKLGVAQIDHAENGQIAVDLVKENFESPYEIVFMDCQMPVMRGYDATLNIRKFEKEAPLERHRIVGVSAGAMEGDAEYAINIGMDEYITKPFRIDAIRSALEKAFAAKS